MSLLSIKEISCPKPTDQKNVYFYSCYFVFRNPNVHMRANKAKRPCCSLLFSGQQLILSLFGCSLCGSFYNNEPA